MVASLDFYPRPSNPVSVAVCLSPTPLLPHLPVVPLIVSLWLFTRHCRPGSGFLEGKSPSLGPRMTVVGEFTPRERGLEFFFFLSFVECVFFVFVFLIFVEWFLEWFLVFELCVLQ